MLCTDPLHAWRYGYRFGIHGPLRYRFLSVGRDIIARVHQPARCKRFSCRAPCPGGNGWDIISPFPVFGTPARAASLRLRDAWSKKGDICVSGSIPGDDGNHVSKHGRSQMGKPLPLHGILQLLETPE